MTIEKAFSVAEFRASQTKRSYAIVACKAGYNVVLLDKRSKLIALEIVTP